MLHKLCTLSSILPLQVKTTVPRWFHTQAAADEVWSAEKPLNEEPRNLHKYWMSFSCEHIVSSALLRNSEQSRRDWRDFLAFLTFAPAIPIYTLNIYQWRATNCSRCQPCSEVCNGFSQAWTSIHPEANLWESNFNHTNLKFSLNFLYRQMKVNIRRHCCCGNQALLKQSKAV